MNYVGTLRKLYPTHTHVHIYPMYAEIKTNDYLMELVAYYPKFILMRDLVMLSNTTLFFLYVVLHAPLNGLCDNLMRHGTLDKTIYITQPSSLVDPTCP